MSLRNVVNISILEETLALHMRALAIYPVREYQFELSRNWRFDFAFPAQKIAIECEGAAGYGRHSRKDGFEKDMEKYNAATLLGWRLLRYGMKTIKSGKAIDEIEELLSQCGVNKVSY